MAESINNFANATPKPFLQINESENNADKKNNHEKTLTELSNEILYFSINQDSKWVRTLLIIILKLY